MAHCDNSALIALSTLRDLEADRVRHDHQLRAAAVEAERLARVQREEQAREAIERAAAEQDVYKRQLPNGIPAMSQAEKSY